MLSRLTGTLAAIETDRLHVEVAGLGLTLEVMPPAWTVTRLAASRGQEITLHTVLFIEGGANASVMTPRLAGFLHPDDRELFRLLTTVKGIGNRKALRMMSMVTGQLAAAIADRDVKLLQTLPEVGKRTAETIIVTLRDKVEGLATMMPDAVPDASSPQAAPQRRRLEGGWGWGVGAGGAGGAGRAGRAPAAGGRDD